LVLLGCRLESLGPGLGRGLHRLFLGGMSLDL
jgi:hypothetical protein